MANTLAYWASSSGMKEIFFITMTPGLPCDRTCHPGPEIFGCCCRVLRSAVAGVAGVAAVTIVHLRIGVGKISVITAQRVGGCSCSRVYFLFNQTLVPPTLRQYLLWRMYDKSSYQLSSNVL
jgi:hypothetical protein